MNTQYTPFQHYETLIQQVNHVMAETDSDTVQNKLLAFVVTTIDAEAGMLYLYDISSDELILQAVRYAPTSTTATTLLSMPSVPSLRLPLASSMAGYALMQQQPTTMFADTSCQWQQIQTIVPTIPIHHVWHIPLLVNTRRVGVIQLINVPTALPDGMPLQPFLHTIGALVAPHIERSRQLLRANYRERRFKELIDMISCMSTTLERDQLLDDIMNYAQELLEVEATSIWIRDEDTGDLVLHIGTGERIAHVREVRVPANQGIIGNVVNTGIPIVVNDVAQDTNFYHGIDKKSGFTTRAIMCVPLRAPNIQLGGERGELQESIIGGAQALNKRDGQPFNEEDTVLFEMLANQAATILQISELYTQLSQLYNELALLFNETRRLSQQNYKMFWGIIKGIASFIDRKDPYTRGHSLRVAEFSVDIARELKLPEKMIQHIHIGGILHDVGKIAVPDDVLKKPSRLTDEEMDKMKLHPMHGIALLEESDLIWLLPKERQAIEEHHERLDGSGYPKGLRGIRSDEDEENGTNTHGISLIGRIVAVADSFDAMTSDRPYRPGMGVEKAIAILREAAGTEFDPMCVEALVRARLRGGIQVQCERDEHHQPQPEEYHEALFTSLFSQNHQSHEVVS